MDINHKPQSGGDVLYITEGFQDWRLTSFCFHYPHPHRIYVRVCVRRVYISEGSGSDTISGDSVDASQFSGHKALQLRATSICSSSVSVPLNRVYSIHAATFFFQNFFFHSHSASTLLVSLKSFSVFCVEKNTHMDIGSVYEKSDGLLQSVSPSIETIS